MAVERGSREHLLAELALKAEAWSHLGNAKEAEALAAFEAIRAGADAATAGGTDYEVTG